MYRVIKYTEAVVPESLRMIAHQCGICDESGVSNTHLWLSGDAAWSLLGNQHFGLPFSRINMAMRIAKQVQEAQPGSDLKLLEEDFEVVKLTLLDPKPPAGLLVPPPAIYQALYPVFRAIHDAAAEE